MNDAKPKPWGTLQAVVGEGDKARWLTIATVWKSERGNLTGTLDTLPMAWLAGNPARFVLKERSNDDSKGRK